MSKNTSSKAWECDRKVRYENQIDTHEDLEKIKKSADPIFKRSLEAYYCKHCHGWHIGRNFEVWSKNTPKGVKVAHNAQDKEYRRLRAIIKKAKRKLNKAMKDSNFQKEIEKSEKQLDEQLERLAEESKVDPKLLDEPADI